MSFVKVTSPGVAGGACARRPIEAAASSPVKTNRPSASGRRSLDMTTSSWREHFLYTRGAHATIRDKSEGHTKCNVVTSASFSCIVTGESRQGGIVRGFRRTITGSISLGLILTTVIAIGSQERAPAGEWRYYGGNKAFTRYSPLDQINRDNVKNLKIVWRRPAVSEQLTQAFPDVRVNNYLRATPIIIDGVLYTQSAHGLVVAFDGETGKTVWEQELFARTREEANGQSTRGVDYWRGSGNADPRIFAIRGEWLYALNAKTGKPIPGFGEEGRASLHFTENQPLAGRFNDSTGPLVVSSEEH